MRAVTSIPPSALPAASSTRRPFALRSVAAKQSGTTLSKTDRDHSRLPWPLPRRWLAVAVSRDAAGPCSCRKLVSAKRLPLTDSELPFDRITRLPTQSQHLFYARFCGFSPKRDESTFEVDVCWRDRQRGSDPRSSVVQKQEQASPPF